ncbi:ABC transporter substrate-binding protein [Microvirga sp. M2]|uniref:ABC transporter substrate-binding protein n=1 Tax=Microvirga sp. M2 TaxID=3073270 RepID=UPI0039C3FB7B
MLNSLMRTVRRNVVLTPIILAAVFGGAAEATTKFRVAIPEDALTLDPIASSDNPSIWTELLIFDQLIRPTPDGKNLSPGLAEKWTISPDGLEYVFTLRDAKFSNGDPVTTDDVIYSLQRAAGDKSDWARFFKPITHFEAVDAKTIRMKLDKPFTPMLNNLALFSASIVPKNLVEADKDFFLHPIGSGPFTLTRWSKGEKIELAKNPHYWQVGKPAIDTAELDIINEDNARVLKLQAGEIDATIDVPYNQMSKLAADPGIKVGTADVFRIDLVQLNTTKKPFDDVRVRQALNYAVNKDAIIRSVLFGNGKPAVAAIPIMAYHNEELKPYPVDEAKAKSLLAGAGHPNGFSTTLLVPAGNVTYRQVATVLQAALKKIGVTVELQTIEGSSQFSTTKAGNYEMSLSYATSDTIDPDQLTGFTSVNPERANAFHTQWHDDRVNELYALERQTLDGPERGKQFKEIEQRVHDAAPFIFLYHPQATYASRADVEGFRVLPTSNFRLEDVVVK